MSEEKKKNNKKIKLIVAFLIVFIFGWFGGSEYKKYQLRQGLKEAFKDFPAGDASTSNNDSEGKTVKEELEEKKIIEKQKGDLVELATMNIKVEEVEEMKQTTKEYGSPGVADEGTKFVLIKLSVTNTTKAPFSFSENGFVLISNEDVKYNPTDPYMIIDDYLDQKELQPNIPLTGNIIYQIPENVGNYSLISSKAGTNEVYKVNLK